jgi:LemA protein
MRLVLIAILFISTAASLTGCGVQDIPRTKNMVDQNFAEITNQYKRRADLIPNLVQVVKGYATHEKETLEGVINARAKATSINIDPSKATPEQLQKYQEAQGQLGQALGRLMVVSEQYPNLKADQNFRDLQAQIEGTENRITNARRGYIESITAFNNLVSVFPTNLTNTLFFHYDKIPQWNVADGEKEQIEKAPKVEF